MEINEKIKFNNKYPKLNGQRFARLLAVFTNIEGCLLQSRFPDLVMYDTERDDGRFYELDTSKKYMLLIFRGDKGFLFTSLRKDNPENFDKYNGMVGQWFKIEIERAF